DPGHVAGPPLAAGQGDVAEVELGLGLVPGLGLGAAGLLGPPPLLRPPAPGRRLGALGTLGPPPPVPPPAARPPHPHGAGRPPPPGARPPPPPSYPPAPNAAAAGPPPPGRP